MGAEFQLGKTPTAETEVKVATSSVNMCPVTELCTYKLLQQEFLCLVYFTTIYKIKNNITLALLSLCPLSLAIPRKYSASLHLFVDDPPPCPS